MTDEYIKNTYTRLLQINETEYNAYLAIGCQSFCVVNQTDYKRADWYRNMLVIAIKHLLEDHSKENIKNICRYCNFGCTDKKPCPLKENK